MSADPYHFCHWLRVRWGECDMQGIVFNPNYMVYLDVAFTEYWRAIGMAHPNVLATEGLDNFMVASALRYRDAARYDDELDIFVRTEFLGTTSFRIGVSVRRAGGVLVEGAATYVIGDRETRAPRKLPAALVAAVVAFETHPPERKAPAD